MRVVIRAVAPTDRDWLSGIFAKEGIAEREPIEVNMLNLTALPGFVAQVGDEKLGVISYQIAKKHYEIIMLHSERPGLGIGRALVNSVIMEANDAKCLRVVTVTKNGNEKAVSFYKGCGFVVSSVRPGTPVRGTTSRHAADGASAEPIVSPNNDEIELVFKLSPPATQAT
jgi:GNAT superfamily N-acetyltransferase